MTNLPTRQTLFDAGLSRLRTFCTANALVQPQVHPVPADEWYYVSACAYYRPNLHNQPRIAERYQLNPDKPTIMICIQECASIGTAGRAWSYPGYTVDRTPYGVLQHELGHHVDYTRTPEDDRVGWQGLFSVTVRAASREAALTGYAPDAGEWFAEMFRLFVTNPDLLERLRPRVYAALIMAGFKPVESRPWDAVLAEAPVRTVTVARKRVGNAR